MNATQEAAHERAQWRMVKAAGHCTVAHSGAVSLSYCERCATKRADRNGTGKVSVTGCRQDTLDKARALGVTILRFDRLTFEQAWDIAVKGPMVGCACDVPSDALVRSFAPIFGGARALDYVSLAERVAEMVALNPESVEGAPA